VSAKHVVEGPFTVTINYCGKLLKSQQTHWGGRGDGVPWEPHYGVPTRNRTRTLTRLYKVTPVKLNVGKIGLVIGRNKHLLSQWDVLVDGIVYAVSAKFLKILETPEDVASVEKKVKNKPALQKTQ
jgi:hypothetical protein